MQPGVVSLDDDTCGSKCPAWPGSKQCGPGCDKPANKRLSVFSLAGPCAPSQEEIGNIAQACAGVTRIACQQRQVRTPQLLRAVAAFSLAKHSLQRSQLALQSFVGHDIEDKKDRIRVEPTTDDIDPGNFADALEGDMLA